MPRSKALLFNASAFLKMGTFLSHNGKSEKSTLSTRALLVVVAFSHNKPQDRPQWEKANTKHNPIDSSYGRAHTLGPTPLLYDCQYLSRNPTASLVDYPRQGAATLWKCLIATAHRFFSSTQVNVGRARGRGKDGSLHSQSNRPERDGMC